MTQIEKKRRISALNYSISAAQQVIDAILKKVAVNAEFAAVGEELPHDPQELHAAAQAQRATIEAAKEELESLQSE